MGLSSELMEKPSFSNLLQDAQDRQQSEWDLALWDHETEFEMLRPSFVIPPMLEISEVQNLSLVPF